MITVAADHHLAMDVDGDSEAAAGSGASPRTWTEELLVFLERKQAMESAPDRDVVVIDDSSSSEDELSCVDAMDAVVVDEGREASTASVESSEEVAMPVNLTMEGATKLMETLVSRLNSSCQSLELIYSKDDLDSEDFSSADEEKMDRDFYDLLSVILNAKKLWPDTFTTKSISEMDEINRLLCSADVCKGNNAMDNQDDIISDIISKGRGCQIDDATAVCKGNNATDNQDDIISDIISKGRGCQIDDATAVTEIAPVRGLSNQTKPLTADMFEILGHTDKRLKGVCNITCSPPHPIHGIPLSLEDEVDVWKQKNGEATRGTLNTKVTTFIDLTGASEQVAAKDTSTTTILSPSIKMIENSSVPCHVLELEQKNIASGAQFTTSEVKEPQRPSQTLLIASKFYKLHIYTMGTKAYATEMAKILDPTGALFAGRVIAKGSDADCLGFNERMPKSKDLDGVLGMESAVVIIDDTASVWPDHKYNLINVERYMYFPCSRRKFGVSGPSLLECCCDERTSDGTLASLLAVIVRIHCEFFSHSKLHEADVRTILASQRRNVLAGCIILFSGIIPVEEKDPRRHPTWRTAENFGAICTNHIDDKVTHVVARLSRTEKVIWALTNKRFVVSPAWVEASALLYRRADEFQFRLKENH